MKFSSFITIALLALIAYALLRPAPSPTANTVRDILRLAKEFIPPARTGGQDSPRVDEPPLPTPGSGAQGLPPWTQQPNLMPQSNVPANGKPRSQSKLTWDPFSKGDESATRLQYTGLVREHLNGDCLLVRCDTGTKRDSGTEGEYVLAGFPNAAESSLNTQIQFFAYSGGVVTYDNDTETKSVSILVYSATDGSRNPPAAQNARPAENTEAPKDSWMWRGNSSLDRGPYNQKRQ